MVDETLDLLGHTDAPVSLPSFSMTVQESLMTRDEIEIPNMISCYVLLDLSDEAILYIAGELSKLKKRINELEDEVMP